MASRQAEQREAHAGLSPLPERIGLNDNLQPPLLAKAPLRFALCLTIGLAFGLACASYVISNQPDRYAASSQIYVETGLARHSTGADAVMKAAGLQLQSPDFLTPVVDALHLASRNSSTGPAKPAAAVKILQAGLSVQSDPASQIMTVGYTGPSATQSAQIVNELVSRLAADFEARRTPAASGSAAVDEARLALLQAQTALQDFELSQSTVDPSAGPDLASDLAAQEAKVADLEAAAVQMKSVSLKDIVSGALPPTIETARLQQLRDTYAAVNRTFQTLSINLGPRHPQLLAATAARDQAVEDIRTELKAIARTVATDLKAAKAELKALSQRKDPLARDMNEVADLSAQLQALKQAVADKRQAYDDARAAAATDRSSAAPGTRLRIITRAFPAEEPVGLPKMLQWVLFGLAGAAFGLCLATLVRPARRFSIIRAAEPQLPATRTAEPAPEPVIAPVQLPVAADPEPPVTSLLSVLEEQQRDEQERLQREEALRERLRRLVMLTEQVAEQTTYQPTAAVMPAVRPPSSAVSVEAIRADFQTLKRRLAAARQA